MHGRLGLAVVQKWGVSMLRKSEHSSSVAAESSARPNFTQGSLNGFLMQLSIPALITILANLSFLAVDTYFISLIGKQALIALFRSWDSFK